MNNILLNVLVGAGTGTGKAVVGYLAVAKQEDFDWYKFFVQGVLVGTIGGGLLGAIAQDPKLAVIGALGADDIRSAFTNFRK